MFKIGYGGYVKTNKLLETTFAKNIKTDYILFSLDTRLQYKLKKYIEPPFSLYFKSYFLNDDFYFDMIIKKDKNIIELSQEVKNDILKLVNRETYLDDYCLLLDCNEINIEGFHIPQIWIEEYMKNIKNIKFIENLDVYPNLSGENLSYKIDEIVIKKENPSHDFELYYSIPLIFEKYNDCQLVNANLKDFFHYEETFGLILASFTNKFYNLFSSGVVYLPESFNVDKSIIIDNFDVTKLKNFYKVKEEILEEINKTYGSAQNYIFLQINMSI